MARTELLERYHALPLPTTRDEHWRFTDLAGFDPDGFLGDFAEGVAAPPAMLELDVSGIAHLGEAGVTVERAPDGIRFEALTDDHPLLGTLVGTDDKFSAHNAALWEHGLLVHVPAGVEVEQPLYLHVANAAAGGSSVLADPGRGRGGEPVHADRGALVGVHPGWPATPTARWRSSFTTAPRSSTSTSRTSPADTWLFASCHARVERDAELDWVTGGFGSAKGKVRIQNDLAGQGATSRVTGAYFADGAQHLDYDTYQRHIAPSTTSDFAFKGVLRDTATAVWRGMIRVEEGAQKTNAYQENRNLLLSRDAHANSIPGLEILANDVRCTHGATLGQVDREQLFYLMSRGLSRAEAERLIVRGFFQDVLDRVELAPVREALGAALEARIPQA